MNIMNDMDLEWTRIRQRRTKIVKQMKQLKSNFNQLIAREACVKNFMDNYEKPSSSSSSSDDKFLSTFAFIWNIKGER